MNDELRIGLLLAAMILLIFGCSEDKPALGDYPDVGLISYFPFDGNINDVMGNSTGGVNHNFATFSPGKFGEAVTFNGVDEYIDYTARTYNSQSRISVSLWFKVSFNAGWNPLVRAGEFSFQILNGDAIFSIFNISTSSATGGVISNTWIHLAGTYDGDKISIYVNGLLKETVSHPGTITTSGLPLTLGKHNIDFLEGNIDELFIYERVLSQEEVTMLYER